MFMLFACNNSSKKANEEEQNAEKKCEHSEKKECCKKDFVCVDSLINNVDHFIDKEVKIMGECTKVDTNENYIYLLSPSKNNETVQITGYAGEGIVFDKTLEGKKVMAKGVFNLEQTIISDQNEDGYKIDMATMTYTMKISEIKECTCDGNKEGCPKSENEGCSHAKNEECKSKKE